MYKYILLLSLSFFLCQCQSGDSSSENASGIGALEAAYDANPSGENLQNLLNAYTTDSTGKYLEKQAYLQLSNNRFREGLPALKKVLKNNLKAKHALALASAYEQQQNQVAAQVAYQAYLKTFPNDGQVAEIKQRLSTGIPPLLENLSGLFEKTKNDSLRRAEPKIVSEYVAAAEALALIAPQSLSLIHI